MRVGLMTIFAVALMASAVLGQATRKPATKGAKKAIPASVAVVTDAHGDATTVTDLKARYVPEGGPGDNRALLVDEPVLHVRLVMQEGRITTSDTFDVPFSVVRRLTFPENSYVEIERQDGTVLSVRPLDRAEYTADTTRAFEEKDPTGKVTKAQKLFQHHLAILRQDGAVAGTPFMRECRLYAFLGTAKTSTGKEGEYFIRLSEVRSIEFR